MSSRFSFCFYWLNRWKIHLCDIWICFFLCIRMRLNIFPCICSLCDTTCVSFTLLPTGEFIQPTVMEQLPSARQVPGLTTSMSSAHDMEINYLIKCTTNFSWCVFLSLFSPAFLRFNEQELYIFLKVNNKMIWHRYTLWADYHNQVSSHICHLRAPISCVGG